MAAPWALLIAATLLAWAAVVAGVLFASRGAIARAWRAPVLQRPALVLESDDWGAGPLAQAQALPQIAAVLARHRDGADRRPVLSLALVLAVPDGPRIAAGQGYHRVGLDEPLLTPVLAALREGLEQGVFSLQLHGQEHFWPDTVLAAAATEPAVMAWLRGAPPLATERLPSHLQSRWVDASRLPSVPLPPAAVQAAVCDEVAAYRRIFGAQPLAVVPPTFVWTREVERAWAAQGVQFVVTPGWRSTQRNLSGLPDADEGPIANGDRADGLTYLVRTDYFEPVRGRNAGHALRALADATAQGRPCVLENHRDNFIFDEAQCRHSLAELDALCSGALRQHPGLRFLSTVELGRILRDRDPQWLVVPWRQRLPFVWHRLQRGGRPWKLMRMLGVATLGGWLVRALGLPPGAPAASGVS